MHVAPPLPGSRVQELGDRLIVHFRPRRNGIVFLLVWLTLWTGFGPFVLGEIRAGVEGRWFLLAWLCGWAFGECAAVLFTAWMLWGRAFLIATTDQLEVRREIGPFARSKRYAVGLVRDVRAARVPHDEDERPRKDFCLRIAHQDGLLHVGEGMDKREAEDVASVLLAWIRPGAAWGDAERGERPEADVAPRPGALRRGAEFGVRSVLFPAVIVAILAFAAYDALHDDRPTPAGPPPVPTGLPAAAAPGGIPARRPSPNAFTSDREFAAAMTLRTLATARTQPHGQPSCSTESPTRWSCGVRASATAGPYKGIELTYHCSQSRPHAVHCAPLDPPVGRPH